MKTAFVIFFSFTCACVYGQKAKVSESDILGLMSYPAQGRTEEAIARLKTLREHIGPNDSFYKEVVSMSAYLNDAGYYLENAIADCEELMKIDSSTEINGLMSIGRFKKYMGDFDGAITSLLELIKIEPQNKIVYNNLASAYNAAGRYKEAIHALHLNPNTERSTMENYHFALAFYHLNILDSARYYIDQHIATSQSTQDFSAYKLAALIYSALGDQNKSCTYISTANQKMKDSRQDKEFSKQPERVQNYHVVRQFTKEIEDTKRLEKELCK